MRLLTVILSIPGDMERRSVTLLCSSQNDYAYIQVAYSILGSSETENWEYRPLEKIRGDNYPRYVMTSDTLL